MRSNFAPSHKLIRATAAPFVDESYNLQGLNLTMPDQVMPQGKSPFNLNSRYYTHNDGQSRVAIRTRNGTSMITNAVGETLSTQNVSTATGDLSLGLMPIIAKSFLAGATGLLTRLDVEIENIASGAGHIMVQVCSDNGGLPGAIIGESSILSSAITGSYTFLPAYFIDAPAVVSGTKYWLLLFIQDNGLNSYNLHETAGSDVYSSPDRVLWTALNISIRFKSYVAMPAPIVGYFRYYPSTGNNRTLMASGGSVYAAQDTGAVTVLDSGLTSTTPFMRFASFNDYVVWVNGVDPARWSTDGGAPVDVPNAPIGASLVKVHEGRLFFLVDKTRWVYSALFDGTTYDADGFFYVPDPKSNDPVTAARTFQNHFLIWTHKTKYTVIGTNVANFQMNEAVGTKGAACDEAVAVDHNLAYFMAPDGQIYSFNGVNDTLISQEMDPEFAAIPDKTKVRLTLHNNQLYVYYAKNPSSYNNKRAVYDIVNKQWFFDTIPLVGGLVWNQDNNQLIEFSSFASWMFLGEQNFSDLGKPIDWKYWTNYKTYYYRRRTGQTFGGAATKKRIRRFRPLIRLEDTNFTMLVGRDTDFANDPDMRQYILSTGGAKWGQFVWGDGTKWGGGASLQDSLTPISGRSRHIQYRFERKGVETPVFLYGYIAQIKIGLPK